MFRKTDSYGPRKSYQDDDQGAGPRKSQESTGKGMIRQHATESKRFVDESGEGVVLISRADMSCKAVSMSDIP
jgi:hypothetical protein